MVLLSNCCMIKNMMCSLTVQCHDTTDCHAVCLLTHFSIRGNPAIYISRKAALLSRTYAAINKNALYLYVFSFTSCTRSACFLQVPTGQAQRSKQAQWNSQFHVSLLLVQSIIHSPHCTSALVQFHSHKALVEGQVVTDGILSSWEEKKEQDLETEVCNSHNRKHKL